MDYDVLVIGSGIGGMESAIKLGDMGYQVLLVEKEASVGGRMILLSKVFPTLDCASCISGPKMSSTINHPNITTKTYSEVAGIVRNPDGSFKASVKEKARFVDTSICTGCQECERACSVAVPDQFNANLSPRRAAYIPFPQAVPKKSVIERAGTSPCIGACPAGIKAHGYVSLTREGKYEEAFQLVLDSTPLVGTLGRACYAPCESECTRGSLEGPVPIRLIKRFIADEHYSKFQGSGLEQPVSNGHRIAVVGSGPAGLTAAWQLARKGYQVKIIEGRAQAGGFIRYAIPEYRLPNKVVDDDISNLTALGVQIECGTRVTDLAALKAEGWDAVILATGTQRATRMEVPGEDAAGVQNALEFLEGPALGQAPDLSGKTVVVVGGGNVAMDAARVARRLGATAKVVYRRGREEMPCHHIEADDAQAEGATFEFLAAPVEVLTSDGQVRALRCVKMRLGAPDTSGRRRPEPVAGSEYEIPCDMVVSAIGLGVDDVPFGQVVGADAASRVKVDRKTLQTDVDWLFAAGDVTAGATDITRAIGAGRRAAHMVDRWLNHEPLTGFVALDDRLETIEKDAVLARQKKFNHRDKVEATTDLVAAPRDFHEIEAALTEDQARAGSGSCLDCGICSECNQCVEACPVPGCIDFTHREKITDLNVGAVVVSTGHKLFAADLKPEYGFGTFANVITGMQMDRLLAPTRPFNNVLRPSDGKIPERIAYIACTGSRDKTVGNALCSKFCCMYSIKQNQLIMGALPLADVTYHYMDVRASGKRYDEFYSQARDMGGEFIKGKVSKIEEKPNGDLLIRYEDIENGGGIIEGDYDLVVLAVGIQPNRDVETLFKDAPLCLDEYFYVAEPSEELDPGQTNIPGVFVAGTAAGAKDIVDTILHAGAAVSQVAAHLTEHVHLTTSQEVHA